MSPYALQQFCEAVSPYPSGPVMALICLFCMCTAGVLGYGIGKADQKDVYTKNSDDAYERGFSAGVDATIGITHLSIDSDPGPVVK